MGYVFSIIKNYGQCKLPYIVTNKWKKFNIYLKSLLFITLKSDIEIDWALLMFAGINFYPWGIISTIQKSNISI